MSHFQRVFTVLDKPKHAQVALARSVDLIERACGEGKVVSYCWDPMFDNKQVLDRLEREKLKTSQRAQRKAWLDELLADHPLRTKLKSSVVWTKQLADAVIDGAEAWGADVVVKTVHQSKSIFHTSTDWALLERCPIPVLLTGSKRRRSRKKGRSVLAAVDLAARDAPHKRLNTLVLDAAAQYAALYDGTLHVVFAVEISPVLRDLDIVDERVSKAKVVERIEPYLDTLCETYDLPRARVHMPVGKAGRVVTQVARKVNAELLVLGSYAHRVRQAMGLGNSAQRILARSPCDVLAVHPEE